MLARAVQQVEDGLGVVELACHRHGVGEDAPRLREVAALVGDRTKEVGEGEGEVVPPESTSAVKCFETLVPFIVTSVSFVRPSA